MDLTLDCGYYFFRHGDKDKSTVSGLPVLALPNGSLQHRGTGEATHNDRKGYLLDKDDAKVVWRKLVAPIISKVELTSTRYWVMDALDECVDFDTLFPMIASLEPSNRIRILLTSRKLPEIEEQFSNLQRNIGASNILCEEIFDNTRADIQLYLHGNRSKIHVGSNAEKDTFLQNILEKSEGCFLWVRLVLDELALSWSIQNVQRIWTKCLKTWILVHPSPGDHVLKAEAFSRSRSRYTPVDCVRCAAADINRTPEGTEH